MTDPRAATGFHGAERTQMPTTTRIGYVHFNGGMGDRVRVQAVRRFFDENQLPYTEFSLQHTRPPVNILFELLRPRSLKHLARKCFLDGRHPFLKESNWEVEISQWEDEILSGARQIAREANTVDCFHAETTFAALVCRQVKQLTGKPYVYDAHGFISEEAKLVGSQAYLRACRRWDRDAVNDAQHVIVVSEAARDYLQAVHSFPRDRIVVCPNGTYVKPIHASYHEPLHIVYAGNFAPYENVMTFVKTAALAASDRVRFVLIGDGAQRNEIFDYVNERGIDLTYLGRKKYEQVFDFLGRMQVGFVGYSGEPTPTAHPIKIGDYASCGLPILAAPGAWTEPIERYKCGVIVPTPRPEDFALAIASFLNRDRWMTMSANAKTMAEEVFPWQRQLFPLVELYRRPRGRA